MYWTIIAVLVCECLLTAWWVQGMWRRVRHGLWRGALLALGSLVGLSMLWFVAGRLGWLPRNRVLTAPGVIWAVLGVPFGVVPCLLCWALAGVVRGMRRWRRRHQPTAAQHEEGVGTADSSASISRRGLLTTGLAGFPMVLTLGGTGKGVWDADDFRIHHRRLPVPGLPSALVGLRIAHLTDTHVGGFTPTGNLPRIASATAAEKPDLIVFTGDLMDHSLAEVDAALAFCEQLRAVAPLHLCEGNHDQLWGDPGGRDRLRQALWAREINWLVAGDSRTVTLRGEPVQVLGASWSFRSETHQSRVAEAAAQRTGCAFPLLLAHHPQVFDSAAAAGFPLILSGHTHGGQLMATEKYGAGSVFFDYWSGIYCKPVATLHVSNGVGHWFPLRVNAPAEISMLTLERA